jgi:hypothetical protein
MFVRRVFRNEQRMTVDLLLDLFFALGMVKVKFFEGINILNEKNTKRVKYVRLILYYFNLSFRLDIASPLLHYLPCSFPV